MQQGYQLTVKGSNQLKIASSSPQGVLYQNDISLQVQTSEGADQGAARCQYKDVIRGGFFTEFFQTGGTQHLQSLSDLLRGAYQYSISCRDSAGNVAQTSLSFTVDVDMAAPRILQVYTLGESITVVLDELATCRYRTDTSDFAFDDGLLAGTTTTTHLLTELSSVYYLQCQDAFGNSMDGVTIYV